ncbi:MAG: hypothetical protein LBH70_07715 [Spirochaetaceae bacterium]|jgi:hypothetical protein|nr:hypothetical protein [Spirochaetaceae bacterium]
MKRVVFFLAVIGVASGVYAQSQIPTYRFAAGNWQFAGERLVQNDVKAGLAKVNFTVPQSSAMIYEFNARYETGAEDGHGGFGIHIFGDRVLDRASWGSGDSYLLWLNYDENPGSKDIPSGLSAQVYRSYSHSRMELVDTVDLNEYAYLLTSENLSAPVPVKLFVDGDTGEVRIADPRDPDLRDYFYFYLDSKDVPLKGDYVALRTNGMSLSFAMGL